MIAIAIPFHLKGSSNNDAYEIAFRYYSQLPAIVHFCGSEGDLSRDFASPFLNDTTFYHEVPQGEVITETNGHPDLLKKFNDSLATLPDATWRCLIGADDIVCPEFFRELQSINVRDDVPVVAGVSMGSLYYLIDLVGGRRKRLICEAGAGQKLSSGVTALNRGAMKINKGNVFYAPGAEIGLELEFNHYGAIVPLNGCVINLKGENTLHSFDVCEQYNRAFDLMEFEHDFVNNMTGK